MQLVMLLHTSPVGDVVESPAGDVAAPPGGDVAAPPVGDVAARAKTDLFSLFISLIYERVKSGTMHHRRLMSMRHNET